MAAIQDRYPDDYSHCYGCGRLNPSGLHVKTEWTGTEGLARFQPRADQMAMPGFVYGGLIASLVDCHAIGTAAAAAMQAAGATPGMDPSPRFVTAALEVTFLRPTPLGPPLDLRATALTVTDRKVIVEVIVRAGDVETARGRVVAVPIPAGMRSAIERTVETATSGQPANNLVPPRENAAHQRLADRGESRD